jgi:HAMP domain-containing protein
MAYTGGKMRGIMKGITIEQGRWLAGRLNELSDRQIRDAFRAANYSPSEIELLSQAFRRRVDELNRAVGEKNLAAGK